jgi:hypothetical protein
MGQKFFRQQVVVEKLPDVLRYKWSDVLLSEGVTGVPKKLLRSMSQIFQGQNAVEQLQVALTLVDYRRENEKRLPTVAFISYLAGLPEDVFMARLEELHLQGLIGFERVREALAFDVSGLLRTIDEKTRWHPPVLGQDAFDMQGREEKKNLG